MSFVPKFLPGATYTIRPDGRVDVQRTTRGGTVVVTGTHARDFYGLPSNVRFPCNGIDLELARLRARDLEVTA